MNLKFMTMMSDVKSFLTCVLVAYGPFMGED